MVKRVAAALFVVFVTAIAVCWPFAVFAGVIGSPNDAMGVGMGPVINESTIPAPNPGSSAVREQPQQGSPAHYGGVGDFRTYCLRSHFAHNDPLVWPGQPNKSHLHVFFGNTSTDAFSSDASLDVAPSTCHGGADNRSAYWVPSLIDTRTGAPMDPLGVLVYYKGDTWDWANGVSPILEPVPLGLRVIAGNAKNDHDLTRDANGNPTWVDPLYTYKCVDPAQWFAQVGSDMVTLTASCPANTQLWIFLRFPRCWDGVHLDSPDHKSHMSYPVGGACPATHPHPLPHLTYVVQYAIAGGEQLRLSSDMYPDTTPAGYSMHGDYIMRWNPTVMKQFVNGCLNAGNDCHNDLLGNGLMLY